MQYKNKKNLYKILFITILLGFIISLAGCDWLSLGLLNVIDPKPQIRIKNFDYVDDYKNVVTFEVYSINQVEFIISGFELEYYRGSTKLDSLKSSIEVNLPVAPSSGPGVEGPATKITDLCLYTPTVLKYVKDYSAFNEISCDLYIIGKGAGYNLKVKVADGLAALGVDNTLPTAIINVIPEQGNCPLEVIFDGSGSKDGDGIGIAKYDWYVPEEFDFKLKSNDILVGNFPCNVITDSEEVVTVLLTVTDYHGNKDSDAKSVTIKKPESSSGGECP